MHLYLFHLYYFESEHKKYGTEFKLGSQSSLFEPLHYSDIEFHMLRYVRVFLIISFVIRTSRLISTYQSASVYLVK